MNRNISIGLTGPTGAGKSTLRALTGEFGLEWLDCDEVARQIVEPGQPALAELAAHFGSDVILPDGTLDRRLVASRAFPTEEGRAALNSITHPKVLERLLELSEKAFAEGRQVVIDAPLLFEGRVDSICQATIAVLAPRQERLQRIMERDSISEEQALLRMNAQPDDDFYRSRCTYTLYNDGTGEELLEKGRQVLREILSAQK